ncbi:MAG TPA: hypothetical protein VEZ48_00560 [Sphingomonadaceae bacterium]|nr:hypothetical protein [Sphingomonadaceae bacterium]
MKIKTVLLSAVAIGVATPALAQNEVANAVDTSAQALGNATDTVANAAGTAGDTIANGASTAVNSVDNAVDVDVTADPSLGTGDMNMTTDNGMMPMDDMNMVTTTTTTTTDESDGGGRWGLLGLLGLLSFLFRPKKPAIHLDERHNRV